MTNRENQQLEHLRQLAERAEHDLKNCTPDQIYTRLNSFIKAKEDYVAFRRDVE